MCGTGAFRLLGPNFCANIAIDCRATVNILRWSQQNTRLSRTHKGGEGLVDIIWRKSGLTKGLMDLVLVDSLAGYICSCIAWSMPVILMEVGGSGWRGADGATPRKQSWLL